MEAHPRDASVVADALGVLRNVTTHRTRPEDRRMLIDTASSLLAALTAHAGDPALVSSALWTLLALAREFPAVHSDTLHRAATAALGRHPGNRGVEECAQGLLALVKGGGADV
jgi:hypothetical protein